MLSTTVHESVVARARGVQLGVEPRGGGIMLGRELVGG